MNSSFGLSIRPFIETKYLHCQRKGLVIELEMEAKRTFTFKKGKKEKKKEKEGRRKPFNIIH